MTKFSIIIPVYNNRDLIFRAVQGVLDQTYDNWNLIIVDDGSDLDASTIYDGIQLNNKKIKVMHQLNQGPFIARINGLKYATGDYVLFLDSDDYYNPNF